MRYTLDDLKTRNKLAEHYKKFNVSERLLLTGHSHQAHPDVAKEGMDEAWKDAYELVDKKWETAFQKAEIVKEGYKKILNDKDCNISLGQNTHELLLRFLSILDLKKRPKIITTKGEFHTIRRQLGRLAEEEIEVVRLDAEPVENLVERIIHEIDDKTAAVLVSHVFFESGKILPELDILEDAASEFGVELLVDAYHALNVVPFDINKQNLKNSFVIGGGYKYLQLGEGNCMMRFPSDREFRPVITGWFSEFGTLSEKKGSEIQYGRGDLQFAGSTYDPVSHYRAARVFKFFNDEELTPEFLREVSQYQIKLLADTFDSYDFNSNIITRDTNYDLSNIGGFLVMKSNYAEELSDKLYKAGVLTDSRGTSLRFGPAPYLNDDQIKESISRLYNIVKEY